MALSSIFAAKVITLSEYRKIQSVPFHRTWIMAWFCMCALNTQCTQRQQKPKQQQQRQHSVGPRSKMTMAPLLLLSTVTKIFAVYFIGKWAISVKLFVMHIQNNNLPISMAFRQKVKTQTDKSTHTHTHTQHSTDCVRAFAVCRLRRQRRKQQRRWRWRGRRRRRRRSRT